MSIIRLPSEQEVHYPAARGPVLLLSCMDLRLLDEVGQFMDHDGLTNRYDHVILAGAALGALGAKCHHPHWNNTFFDHLKIAFDLHHIKDVYILEHRDCGAYGAFLGDAGKFDDDHQDEEEACHRKYAEELRLAIDKWVDEENARRKVINDKAKCEHGVCMPLLKLNVKSFLMDLRGHVHYLAPDLKAAKKERKPPKRRSR